MSHQKNNAQVGEKLIQLIILVVIVFAVAFVAYTEYKNTLKETTNELNERIIKFHFETFNELSKIYLKDTQEQFIEEVKNNKELRSTFEDMLRLIKISTIQNLFVITRDSDQNYYFLLDSDTNPQTRASLLEPFNPLDDFWDSCYELQKPQVFHQKNSKDLWITIAYPIVENGHTVALIGADISQNLDVNIQTKLQNFSDFFLWIVVLSILWFTTLYISTLYFKRKVDEGYIDPLTNAYNRTYLYEILIKKLAREYQLFMIDIDFFKKVNDTYGHDAGDFVLREVARRLGKLIRDEDSLIRYGGEEFLIYTTQLNAQQCGKFAERLRENVKAEPIIYKNIECSVTISIGCNPYGSKNEVFEDVLKKADEALYMAKVSGRDCVKVAK